MSQTLIAMPAACSLHTPNIVSTTMTAEMRPARPPARKAANNGTHAIQAVVVMYSPFSCAAKNALQWVIDNAKDDEFKQLARLRLSGILLDEKTYDAALKLLDPAVLGKGSAEMAGAFADRRADVMVAQDNPSGAKAEYEKALATLPATSPLRQLVQLKLDALGS